MAPLDRVHRRLRTLAARVYMNPFMQYVPPLPLGFGGRYLPPHRPWTNTEVVVPEALRAYPGVQRIAADEVEAFRAAPLQDLAHVHSSAFTWLRGHAWRSFLPLAPRMWRARVAAMQTNTAPIARPGGVPAIDVKAHLKVRAAQLGISAIGVAIADEHYTFELWRGETIGDRIIVCLLEQDFASTQTIATPTAEKAALSTYAELMQRASVLARDLHDLGYQAHVQDPLGRGVAIHYAVAAGLGQLGLNGQLLTPTAGSRCRLIMVETDAPLEPDEPKDFGIPKVCDACQICVQRCPPGAIPNRRQNHRGVIKSKLNMKRCFPVVAQANGCAICMKVCPVQRYGLQPVLDEYAKSGTILGRGTDELEGFTWPLDGAFYGPGQKPRISDELMFPPGLDLIPSDGARQREGEHSRTWA